MPLSPYLITQDNKTFHLPIPLNKQIYPRLATFYYLTHPSHNTNTFHLPNPLGRLNSLLQIQRKTLLMNLLHIASQYRHQGRKIQWCIHGIVAWKSSLKLLKRETILTAITRSWDNFGFMTRDKSLHNNRDLKHRRRRRQRKLGLKITFLFIE